jgi:hypothetical protein
MSKRKSPSKSTAQPDRHSPADAVSAPVLVAHPPAKSPSLLAVSVALFALWFVFLLIAAIWG